MKLHQITLFILVGITGVTGCAKKKSEAELKPPVSLSASSTAVQRSQKNTLVNDKETSLLSTLVVGGEQKPFSQIVKGMEGAKTRTDMMKIALENLSEEFKKDFEGKPFLSVAVVADPKAGKVSVIPEQWTLETSYGSLVKKDGNFSWAEIADEKAKASITLGDKTGKLAAAEGKQKMTLAEKLEAAWAKDPIELNFENGDLKLKTKLPISIKPGTEIAPIVLDLTKEPYAEPTAITVTEGQSEKGVSCFLFNVDASVKGKMMAVMISNVINLETKKIDFSKIPKKELEELAKKQDPKTKQILMNTVCIRQILGESEPVQAVIATINPDVILSIVTEAPKAVVPPVVVPVTPPVEPAKPTAPEGVQEPIPDPAKPAPVVTPAATDPVATPPVEPKPAVTPKPKAKTKTEPKPKTEPKKEPKVEQKTEIPAPEKQTAPKTEPKAAPIKATDAWEE